MPEAQAAAADALLSLVANNELLQADLQIKWHPAAHRAAELRLVRHAGWRLAAAVAPMRLSRVGAGGRRRWRRATLGTMLGSDETHVTELQRRDASPPQDQCLREHDGR